LEKHLTRISFVFKRHLCSCHYRSPLQH
jgi:hypothetical protein